MKTGRLRKIYFLIFWTILIVSFVFFAILLILVANGYHLNLKNFSLAKTGMIVLDGDQNGFTLAVNGKTRLASFPIKLTRLFPGRYDVKISKENYQDWTKVFIVDGGQAVLQSNIMLFLKEAKIRVLSKNEANRQDVEESFKKQGQDLKIQDNEVWYKEKLLTRFSQEVTGAIIDNQKSHLYLQLGDEIRAIEIDGSNDILLFKLDQKNAVSFSLVGGKIRFVNFDTVYEATIK